MRTVKNFDVVNVICLRKMNSEDGLVYELEINSFYF